MLSMIFLPLLTQGQSFDITSFQRQFIAQFAGDRPIEGTINVLKQRSTSVERKIAENFLCSTLNSIGLPSNRHEYKMPNSFFLLDLFFSPMQGTNVYTIIPATEPTEEYVVIGAHYDSEPGSPGAGDNASGVALTLAVAKQISELTVRKKKFVIVFFDQEEDDELGSKAFAKKLKDSGMNIHSVHITDIIGWDANQDLGVELQSISSRLAPLYQQAADDLNIPLKLSQGGSSDNKSFLNAGFETVGVFSDEMTPHIHKPSDQCETVDFGYLASSTALIFNVLKALAQQ